MQTWKSRSVISRRQLLGSGASAAAAAPLLRSLDVHADPLGAASPPTDQIAIVDLTVNERPHRLKMDPRTTLLDALRQQLGLLGSKKGCDHGQCGACTVLVEERRVLSCLTLAAAVRGAVTTIEGLADETGELHPMQQAFLEQDAFQCGYCTPGQIVSAVGCVREGHAGTDEEIRHYMSGNLCRCGAYPNIVKAVQQAKARIERS